ncbi:hypothetical protein ACJQWK_05146 [Exserohilum turcicum]
MCRVSKGKLTTGVYVAAKCAATIGSSFTIFQDTMSLTRSRSRSKCRGTKGGRESRQSLNSHSCGPLSDESTDKYNIPGTQNLQSEISTSTDCLLMEGDHGLLLLSHLPAFGTNQLLPNRGPPDLAALIHRHYRAFQFPAFLTNPDWTWKKATTEVIALQKAFPPIKEDQECMLAMAAWFHFLCNVDDEIEQMDSSGRSLILERIIEALRDISLDRLRQMEHIKPKRDFMDILQRVNMSLHRKVPLTTQERMDISNVPEAYFDIVDQQPTINDDVVESRHAKVIALASNFIRQCQAVISPETLPKVFAEVINVVEALRDESAYRESNVLPSIEAYLRLRVRTIGLSPFFAILADTLVGIEAHQAKEFKTGNNDEEKDLHDDGMTSSTGSSNPGFWTSPLHKRLCDCIKITVGLQNDIVGLAKDMEKGERMNLAVLLVEQQNESTQSLEAIQAALSTAVFMHNTEMQNVIRHWADIKTADYSPAVQVYAHSLMAFTRTHLTWATQTDRYHLKHTTISKIFSRVAESTAIEGLRFKARVLRTRKSLRQFAASHVVGPI